MLNQAGVHVLDNPVHGSLSSPAHAHLALTRGRALRYPADVSPFLGLPDDPTVEDWNDAAHLLGPDTAAYPHRSGSVPDDWTVVDQFDLVQMTASPTAEGAPDPRAVRLGPEDVPEMLDLAALTKPGPFLPRTIEMGTYLGIRQDGVLTAMAGERMRPSGWVEISAVCTSPAYRGQGLGTSLVRALIATATDRGDTAFLHVTATNTNAIRLYETLGFTARRDFHLAVLRGPHAVA
ncbi:GNAT family N-acetyltransferase [Umezawaea sp. NPDC059074]|uniref:GNAT family N-acetyltransferase n=1 Tax=Umezawaea sp. NPDC059074 TaxID=3346716 RepID=UPI0036C8A92B